MAANETVSTERAFRDRSDRLVLFGLLTILLGGGALLFGLANLALPFVEKLLPAAAGLGSDLRSALMGFLTYAMIGGTLIWAGVGTVRKRRWVRPVMLTLAWTWFSSRSCPDVSMTFPATRGRLLVRWARSAR